MCNPALAVLAVSSVVAGYGAYQGAKQQKSSMIQEAEGTERQADTAESQALVADNNAQLAEWQAQDSIRRGQIAEGQSKIATATLKSKQRAALAASGVDVTEGTANDIQTGTDLIGMAEADTIRDNALRDAWGYRTQGTAYADTAAAARADAALYDYDAQRIRAGASKISPGKAALTSLLGGAGQVATQWYYGRGK